MAIAAECGAGHKRAYPDGAHGTTVTCLVCGLPVLVPPNSTSPCYQTVPLIPRAEGTAPAYSHQYDLDAMDLFQLARRAILSLATPVDLLKAWMVKGSYSIKPTSTAETVGKIVVYEDALRTSMNPSRLLPIDGIYVWVRANDVAAG